MKPIVLTFFVMVSFADAAVPRPVSGFMQTYCIECHGPKKQKGDFRVDELKVSATAADAENWQLVLDNLHLGEMPPKEAKLHPKPAEVATVTAWIQSELSRAASALKGTGGEVVLRRLNRVEYQNTIAELFDVHGDFTAGFPDDTLDHGFDNNGAALMLSAAQVQEYMKAAEFVLARAIAPAKRPETVSKTMTLHDGNRRGIEIARKNLEDRLANFDKLGPPEQKSTLQIQAAAKDDPAYGYRFPVRENGVLRPPKPDDGPQLDGPSVLHLAGVKVPGHMHGRPFLGKDMPEPNRFVHGTRDRLDETLETTRWLSDGRYHLVRSFDTRPPADQQTLLSCYNSNGELCREIRALKAADSLNSVQKHLWGDSRPPVMLFDTQNDPWCLRDISANAEHSERAVKMLAELDTIMLRDLDLGLWPEPERVAAENGHSAHLRAHRDKLYPLDRILPIAKLVGHGPQHRSTLTDALTDTDASVRYWAAVGLAALGDDTAVLRPHLKDGAASVRIVAAEALVRHAADSAALDLLATELDSRNEWAATRAARSLELLGEKARPKLDIMRDALKRRTSGFFGKAGPDPANYGLEFSLTMALKALEHR